MNIARIALEGRGLHVITHVEYGSPATEIMRVADEERVDLVVMESQGRTTAQEIMIGSLASEIVRCATVPVLILKSHVIRELGHAKCCHPMLVARRPQEKMTHD
jgi:nucleotide-binding universal stress UspA family protein